MIVKIQISLNDAGSTMLIYNQSRSVMFQLPAPPEVVALLGDEPKGFFRVDLIQDELRIVEKLPPQGW